MKPDAQAKLADHKSDRSDHGKSDHGKHPAVQKASPQTSSIGHQHPRTRKDTAYSILSGYRDKHPKDTKEHNALVDHNNTPLQDILYENTYQLCPDNCVAEAPIRNIIRKVLNENLKDIYSDPSSVNRKCLLLSDVIKEKVKSLGMKRYKIVTMVLVGERKGQNMQVASRCLWDQKIDNFVSVTVKNEDLYIIGMVYTIYQE